MIRMLALYNSEFSFLARISFRFQGLGTLAKFAVLLLFTVLSVSQYAAAQKDFLLSMPEVNKYAFNPGYAGLEGSLDITAWGREQWSGVPGRPSTQSLLIHMPLYQLSGAGGLRITNDRLGPLQYVKLELGYSYVVKSDRMLWSVGLTAGVNQISFDGVKLRTVDGIYTGNVVNHNDPNLPNGNLSGTTASLSIGGYLIVGDLEGGVSLQDISFGQVNLKASTQQFNWAPRMQSNVFLEYGVDVSDDWYVYPNIFIKYDFQTLQTLVKVNAEYQNLLSGGIGLRGFSGQTLESLVFSFGYNVDSHFSLHYAYDVGLSGLATQAAGSHEIILSYNLNKVVGKGRIPKIIGNPRYL